MTVSVNLKSVGLEDHNLLPSADLRVLTLFDFKREQTANLIIRFASLRLISGVAEHQAAIQLAGVLSSTHSNIPGVAVFLGIWSVE